MNRRIIDATLILSVAMIAAAACLSLCLTIRGVVDRSAIHREADIGRRERAEFRARLDALELPSEEIPTCPAK